MRETFLPFAKPFLEELEINEVVDSLQSGWITTGPKTKRFETQLADYLQAPHALCLSSATAGLHLALAALALRPEDEVITTPLTFAATLNVVEIVGATIKLIDVERDTYNMDVSQLADAITPQTKVIMPVHFAGAPVDLDPIYDLAQQHGIRVIEDAAHSIGASYKGKKLGSFGDVQVFSFHPNKNITTGEGGCVAVRDNALAEKICLMRFHGMDREAWDRFGKKGHQHYEIVCPGFKYNMLDIQAAIGIHQLPRLDQFIDHRRELVARYQEKMADWPWLILPQAPHFEHRHAWHLFAPTINPEATQISRDTLIAELKNHNIGTGLHYRPAHLYPYYRDKYGFKPNDFPNAEHIGNHILSLPLFPHMSVAEQDDVIDALQTIFHAAS